MKALLGKLTILISILFLSALNVYAVDATFESGQVMVQLDDKLLPLSISSVGGKLTTGIAWLDSISWNHNLLEVQRFLPAPWSPNAHQWHLMIFPENSSAEELLSLFVGQADVETATLNYVPEFFDPNDPQYNDITSPQWYIPQVGVSAIWDNGLGETGDNSVLVAIIDGGVDVLHQDFGMLGSARIFTNPAEEPLSFVDYEQGLQLDGGDNFDDDQNGVRDDYCGAEFRGGITNNAYPCCGPMDEPNPHGTWTSGIAAAQTNNEREIAGIAGGWGPDEASGVKLLPVRVNNLFGIIQGLIYSKEMAESNGMRLIINMSFGFINFDFTQLRQTIHDLYVQDDVEILMIAGAGNQDWDYDIGVFPADYSEVIGVAALDHDGRKARFSNYSDSVDIAAPGTDIPSLGLNNSIVVGSGTSASAPIVSGIAALLWSSEEFSTLSRHALRQRLLATGTSLEESEPLYFDDLGSGSISALQAFTAPERPAIRIFDRVVLADGDEIVEPGENVSLELWLRNYWAEAIDITGVLSSEDPDITILAATSTLTTLQTDAFGVFESEFEFSVSSSTPSGYKYLELALEANSGSYVELIRVPILVAPSRFEPIVVEGVPGPIKGLAIGDVDLDGSKELIFGTASNASDNFIFKVQPNGVYSSTILEAPWRHIGKPAIGNIDTDPEYEIVTIAATTGQTRLYVWNQYLGIEYGPLLVSSRTAAPDPIIEDMNGDGQLDILVCTDNGGQHSEIVLYSISNNQLAELWRYNAPEMSSFRVLNGLACGDLDADFLPEVCLIAKGSYGALPSATRVHYINGESGSIALTPFTIGNNVNPTGAVILGDIVGNDGRLDVAFGATSNNTGAPITSRSIYVLDIAQSQLCGPATATSVDQLFDNPGRIIFDPALTNSLKVLVPNRWFEEANAYYNLSPTIAEGCVITEEFDLPVSLYCVAGNLQGDEYPEVFGCGTRYRVDLNTSEAVCAMFDRNGNAIETAISGTFASSSVWTSPVLDDWNSDGFADVSFAVVDDATGNAQVFNPQLSTMYDRNTFEWPQLHHDSRNTNRYHQPVGGTMSTGTYSLSGRVKLESDLTVPSGATLSLLPGTVVEAVDDAEIVVNGVLNIQGASTDSVIFRVVTGGTQWEGIHVNAGELHASFLRIEDAHLPIFVENPAPVGAPVSIADCEIIGGETGLRFWGGGSYDVDRVLIQDIPSLPNHVGIYFLNAVVFCDGLSINNSAYRTAYVVNCTGKFTNCSFVGATANYGVAFSGATCTPLVRCSDFDHIAPTNYPAASIWCLSSAGPMFGEGALSTNNRIVDNSGSLIRFNGSAGRPVLGNRKNILIQGNLGGGGKFMTWTSPGGSAFDARANYWGGIPFITAFDPPNSANWAFHGYLVLNPGLCSGTGPLDEFDILDSALALEATEQWVQAQNAYLSLAQVDTLPFSIRYASLSRADAIDRIISSIGENDLSEIITALRGDAENAGDSLALDRISLTHKVDNRDYVTAIEGFHELANRNLSVEDSILTLIDILHAEILSGGDTISTIVSHIGKGVGETPVGTRVQAVQRVSALLEELIDLHALEARKATVPFSYALHQNYPNPFNPNTEIRFDLPEAIHAELKVFNILGQEVVTLVDDVRAAGAYKVLWDGKNAAGLTVASGVYIYQIKTPNFTDAKKMMLLR